MVGYKISPLLWAKVKRGLSAGRVQSVALRIVADREAEIDAFIPEEYWSLDAQLKVKGEKRPLTAKFYGTEKKKMAIHSKFNALAASCCSVLVVNGSGALRVLSLFLISVIWNSSFSNFFKISSISSFE